MSENYESLNRAQLSYDYLHTNSTTHEFLFGALAELLDNARDASATKIHIYSVPNESLRGGFIISFLDDGEGMDPGEAADLITFGKSSKRNSDMNHIGMYGNGLKSGSMRIGNDLIMFTKKGASMTCVFLSRTFHELESLEEIIVPMPSFDPESKKSLAKTPQEKEKHRMEMDLILKYSPYKTESDLMAEFAKIDSNSGTMVSVYNLKLLDSGEPELDIVSDTTDILLSNPDFGEFDTDEGYQIIQDLVPEKRSFRAYTGMLYVDPRMRIYIQNKKVRTKRLANALYKPRVYKFSSSRFKTRSENESQKAKEDSKQAEFKAKEAESKARNLEMKYGDKPTKEQRIEIRRAQTSAAELRKDAQLKKHMAERRAKALREPKTVNFIFGINLENRAQDGMFVYNCSRLIKMYQRVGPQSDGGVFCSGVVGIVDVPYMVLEPTHNKQDFADAKEYRHLLKAMGEYMLQYWKDTGIAQQGVSKFWESFGYVSTNWKDPVSQDPKFLRKRAMQLQMCIQCDLCLKWRVLPFAASNIGKEFPDNWICSMNTDPAHNRCSAAEEKPNLPEGVLKKETKTKEQKEKDLAEDIKKKQEMLNKLQTTALVKSAKDLKAKQEEEEEDEESESEEEEEKPVRKGAAKKQPEKPAVVSSSRQTNSAKKVEKKPEKPSPKAPAPAANKRRAPAKEESSEEESEEEVKKAPPPAKKKTPAPTPPPKVQPKPQPVKAQPAVKAPPPAKASPKPQSPKVQSPKPQPARKAEAQTTKPKPRSTSKTETEDDSEVEPKTPVNKRRGAAAPEPDNEVAMEVEPDSVNQVQENKEDSRIGQKVEAKIKKQWFPGSIVEFNSRQKRYRVKFDAYPHDKYDKWYGQDSADVRPAPKADEVPTTNSTPVVQPAQSPAEAVAEAPSSSTQGGPSSGPPTAVNQQLLEDISNGYRTCLRYFLPPQWVMDKDSVSQLSITELSSFPLDDFFDHYEKGLRKLVSSFQLEASTRQQEAESAKSKLSNLRRMIARLLKSINEDFTLDAEADSDQVDELLEACVKQAVEQTNSSS